MKKLILLLFLLPFFAGAQTYQSMPQAGYGPVKRMLFDSVLTLPLGITKLQNISGGRDVGQLRYNVTDSSLYTYSGSRWIKSGIDTSTIYYNLGLKLNISDTAAMMAAAPRVQRFLDSVANLKSSIDLKLNIADSSTMLAPYTRLTQTALKLNISDTSSMLSAYTRLAANALKLNISDTAAMMAAAPRVQRFLDSVANLKTSIATKQNTLTLTTTGTSGAATLTGATLNIPQYLSANIYNSNGSLTGNRTLTLNSQPLTFLGTTRTRFHANGRMTIGDTTDAGFKLDVIGEDARINGLRIGKGNAQLSNNMVIGSNSLASVTTGGNNFAAGINALTALTTGANNIAIGTNALNAVTATNGSVAIGIDAGKLNTAKECVIIGSSAMLQPNTGENQTYVGFQAGRGGSGVYNTALGAFTLLNNNGGGGNTGLGMQAVQANISGSHNTGSGFQALYSTTGSNNSATGSQVLWANTTGANNVAMGYNAGRFITGGSTTATAVDNSILIGFGVKVAANTQTNQIVIGYDATGLGSNTTVIGNSSTTTTGLYGNIRLVSGMATAPASSTASGTVGDIRVTSGFIYVCIATNTWVRTILTTF